MAIELPKVWSVSAGATEYGKWDFTSYLDGDETLTGTPLVVEVTTVDLTLTEKSVNAAVVDIEQRDVAIGKAVTCKMVGFVSGTTYTVRVTPTTTAGRVLPVDQVIACA